MKKLFAAALLLLAGWCVQGQTNFFAVYSFVNGFGQTQNVKQVSFTPLSIGTINEQVVVGDEIFRVVSANYLTNPLISGFAYRVKYFSTITPPTVTALFTNWFPTNIAAGSTVNAADYVALSTNLGNGLYALTKAQADLLYAPLGSGGGGNFLPSPTIIPTLVNGSNQFNASAIVVTNGTYGAVDYINTAIAGNAVAKIRTNGLARILWLGDSMSEAGFNYNSSARQGLLAMQARFAQTNAPFMGGWTAFNCIANPNYSPWVGYWWTGPDWVVANSSYVQFQPSWANRIELAFVTQPLGNTFSVLTNGVLFTSINGFSSTPTGVYTNFAVPGASYYITVQAQAGEGSNFIIGSILINTNAVGIVPFYTSQGGSAITNLTGMPTNITVPIYQGINADLIIKHAKDWGENTITNEYNLTNAAMAEYSIASGGNFVPEIIVGTPDQTGEYNAQSQNNGYRDLAIASTNFGFVNCYTPPGVYQNFTVDGTHPTLPWAEWAGDKINTALGFNNLEKVLSLSATVPSSLTLASLGATNLTLYSGDGFGPAIVWNSTDIGGAGSLSSQFAPTALEFENYLSDNTPLNITATGGNGINLSANFVSLVGTTPLYGNLSGATNAPLQSQNATSIPGGTPVAYLGTNASGQLVMGTPGVSLPSSVVQTNAGNIILMTTNVLTLVTGSSGVSVTLTTNAAGITATVSAPTLAATNSSFFDPANAAKNATNNLGSAAFTAASAYDAAGAAQNATNNLGAAAFKATSFFDASGAAQNATNNLGSLAFQSTVNASNALPTVTTLLAVPSAILLYPGVSGRVLACSTNASFTISSFVPGASGYSSCYLQITNSGGSAITATVSAGFTADSLGTTNTLTIASHHASLWWVDAFGFGPTNLCNYAQ